MKSNRTRQDLGCNEDGNTVIAKPTRLRTGRAFGTGKVSVGPEKSSCHGWQEYTYTVIYIRLVTETYT